MKLFKSYFIIILFLVLAILVAVVGLGWWSVNSRPASDESRSETFVVRRGASAIEIGNLLVEKDIVRSNLAFKIFVQIRGLSEKIQAGEYTLDPSMSLGSIVGDLIDGPDAIWVTVPEGLRTEEIAIIFTEKFGLSGQEAQNYYLEFLEAADGQSGRLFPDTYLFEKQTSSQVIVSTLINTYEKKVEGLGVSNNNLVMASLIEREAITNAEKPTIAGVLYNRLNNDWPLQVDATLQYVVANNRCSIEPLDCKWWTPPTVADKQLSSAFNTYESLGLPPAPIANPGIEAIKAAASPDSTDYFFYIHDPDGQIHFAETLNEHNANVNKYIR